MFYMTVLPGENAENFALRAGRPLCMILRANGLLSGAWVLPGREMAVPDSCSNEAFPCAASVFNARIPEKEGYIFKETEDCLKTAMQKGIPVRTVICAMSEKNASGASYLPVRKESMRIYTCKPRDRWNMFLNEDDLRMLNGCWGRMFPGMKILIYGDGKD